VTARGGASHVCLLWVLEVLDLLAPGATATHKNNIPPWGGHDNNRPGEPLHRHGERERADAPSSGGERAGHADKPSSRARWPQSGCVPSMSTNPYALASSQVDVAVPLRCSLSASAASEAIARPM
jgi:hypothetical protein